MKATAIRKGNIIRVEGTIYRVMTMDHVTPGKGRAHVQLKLRNLIDGNQTEVRLRSGDDVERVMLEAKQMQYLYNDGDGYHFMDTTTYEQVALTLGCSRGQAVRAAASAGWRSRRPDLGSETAGAVHSLAPAKWGDSVGDWLSELVVTFRPP